jgi:phosphohistidine swiveling domain-containing protein
MDKSDRWIVSLDAATAASEVSLVGGKAESLARLINLGYPVPSGFVVTSRAYREYIVENHIQEVIRDEQTDLCSEDYLRATLAAKRIRDAITAGTISDALKESINQAIYDLSASERKSLFAVRSSAGREDSRSSSWAGQFDSFLNVSADDVSDYVKRCWASAFGSRAISYGTGLQVDYQDAPFAVIVQRMVTGKISGVAFSVDPAGSGPNRMLIEAVRGSGETVVGGRDRPYTVIVDKAESIVLRRSFGSYTNTELLGAPTIRKVVSMVLGIERDYGLPVDVEWTLAGSEEVSVLQARPITGAASDDSRSHAQGAGLPDVLDYELTFKVNGLGFLFADLLARGFGYLHPLFTFRQGDFRQYFTNERMEFAAREGYRWLSQPGGFARYQREFEQFHVKAQEAFAEILSSRLSPATIDDFFGYLAQYFEYYSKTDFEFTNLIFLSAEDDDVVRENLRELGEFKDVARVWINRASIDDDCSLNVLLSKLTEQCGVPRDDLDAYKIEELDDLFEGRTVAADVIADRGDSYAVYLEGGRIHYIAGTEAAEYVDRVALVEESLARSDVVGQVANRSGQARIDGVVRVINVDYGDLDRMDREMAEMIKGEILVSEFTAPELMAACRKAKAIVTDLGGMLSHAAIVSRELGIPCLVGTQHASRALKTGDQVTIDLDAGFVEKAP